MLVLRSRPLARNDSVDVIIGTGIVLELPNGFGSGIVFNDMNILLSIQFDGLFLLLLLLLLLYCNKYMYVKSLCVYAFEFGSCFAFTLFQFLA